MYLEKSCANLPSAFHFRPKLLGWGASSIPTKMSSPRRRDIYPWQSPRGMFPRDHCRAWQLRGDHSPQRSGSEVTGGLFLSSDLNWWQQPVGSSSWHLQTIWDGSFEQLQPGGAFSDSPRCHWLRTKQVKIIWKEPYPKPPSSEANLPKQSKIKPPDKISHHLQRSLCWYPLKIFVSPQCRHPIGR